MIQRIQTVFLAIVFISGIISFVFPIAAYTNDATGTYQLSVTGMKYMEANVYIDFASTSPMLILMICSILLSGAAIFMYGNRRKQLLVVNTAFLINVILIAVIFLLYSNRMFRDIVKAEPSYELGAFLPLISIVFLILASRAIRKDEALVKSADRLR